MIHIVTPDSICEEMIYARCTDFHRKYPFISIRSTTGDSALLLDIEYIKSHEFSS